MNDLEYPARRLRIARTSYPDVVHSSYEEWAEWYGIPFRKSQIPRRDRSRSNFREAMDRLAASLARPVRSFNGGGNEDLIDIEKD